MVVEAQGSPITLPVAANEVRILRFVTLAAAGIDEAAGATDEVEGISQEAMAAGNAGRTIPVGRPNGGKHEVTAGAAVAVGALVTSDATGRAVTAATGNAVFGRCTVAAGAADEVCTILFRMGADTAP